MKASIILFLFLTIGHFRLYADERGIKTEDNVRTTVDLIYNGPLSNSTFAMKAEYEDGEPIVQINSSRKMNPASNLKLLTAGAALTLLGPDYRWATRLYHDGTVESDGTLCGNIWIVGEGDPTLGSSDRCAEPVAETFARWHSLILASGIRRIDGAILGDGSWAEGMRDDPTWWSSDLGTFYGTCLSGLNYYENRIDFDVVSGSEVGDSVCISQVRPSTPWMSWKNECRTETKEKSDGIYMYPGREYQGIFRGSAPSGKKTVEKFRNSFPEFTLVSDFTHYLSAKGMELSADKILGDPRSMEDYVSEHRDVSLTAIGETLSPRLEEVMKQMLRQSNNLYAELMFRSIGKQLLGSTTISGAKEAAVRQIGKICGSEKISDRDLMMQDGSGLSDADLITPSFMCLFLRSMTSQPCFGTYLNALSPYRERVKLKTGTIFGVRNLSGYISPSSSSRRIVFSIMVGNSELKKSEIRRLEERIIDALSLLN